MTGLAPRTRWPLQWVCDELGCMRVHDNVCTFVVAMKHEGVHIEDRINTKFYCLDHFHAHARWFAWPNRCWIGQADLLLQTTLDDLLNMRQDPSLRAPVWG